MKTITINRILTKIDNTIVENFSIHPFFVSLLEANRDVYYKIKYIVNRNSIQKYYKRIDSIQSEKGWINTYEYDPTIKFNEELVANFKFEYIMSGGSKTCDKCIFYRLHNKKKYCWLRGVELQQSLWYKCIYWQEDSLWWKVREKQCNTSVKKIDKEWEKSYTNTGEIKTT